MPLLLQAVYRPSVSFSRSPDLHLALALEARLEPGWGLQPFPDCLTPQVRCDVMHMACGLGVAALMPSQQLHKARVPTEFPYLFTSH